MVSIVKSKSPRPQTGEPAWDIARLFPLQGYWDEGDYLALGTNHLVEFTDGRIEVLAMPKPAHQRIVLYLCDEIRAFVRPEKLGEALIAPMPVRLRARKYREPDVMFMLAKHAKRKSADYWKGADLVMEVVSDDDESRRRDHKQKREDYAAAGIPEYWIVDPATATITVLSLHRGEYRTHGEFKKKQRATSVLLAGFSVEVGEVFGAATAP
ncbi:MAG TPA: Uma2 family endonuclease [Tepidisphaeraceae bacterium]|jgi:Uma2 family endonuclease|nr:Uma2 family endonuclease [Tepidisphaeraceae bacterium]